MSKFHEWIGFAAQAIEVFAVALMITLILVATIRWLMSGIKGGRAAYEHYRAMLGRSLLLGLELLVAADIIQTVIIDTTISTMAQLGLLILVRTVLGWTLSVEVEGHWPWQEHKQRTARPGAE